MMHKDLRKLQKNLEAQGFTTRATKKGHLMVFKGIRPVTTFAGTPSDGRSWQNSLAACKRHGYRP